MEIQELHKELAKEALTSCRFGSRLDYWQIKEWHNPTMLVAKIGAQAIIPAVELSSLPEDREYLPGRLVRFNLDKYSYTCPQSSTQLDAAWVILSPILPGHYVGRGPNIYCPQLADYNDKLIEKYGTKVVYPDSQLWPLELGVIYRYDAGVPIGAYELRKILRHLPDWALKRVSNAVASENDERFYENTLIK